MLTVDALVREEMCAMSTYTRHPELEKYYAEKKFDPLTMDALNGKVSERDMYNHRKRTYRSPIDEFNTRYYEASKHSGWNTEWQEMEEEWDTKRQKKSVKDIQSYLSYLEHEILVLQKLMPETQLNNWFLQNVVQENLLQDINSKIALLEKQLYQLQVYRLKKK